MKPGYCNSFGCPRVAVPGRFRCETHLVAAPVDAEYEALRMDPTTDLDRWDVWDGGLERPGEDEF